MNYLRVVALDGKIVLIRPKLVLCDEDNYRETRWFTAWTKVRQTEDFYLPRFIRDVTGQTKVRCVMDPLVNRNYYECTVKSPTVSDTGYREAV